MKTLFLLLGLIFNLDLLAQETEKELKTKIEEVTVFVNSAQVSRSGKVLIPQGKTMVILKNLSPYIDQQSLQVTAKGDFTILSVSYGLNYLQETAKTQQIEELIKKISILDDSIGFNKAQLEVNKEMLDMLNKNKKLGNEATGTDINQLKVAVKYYQQEIIRIKEDDILTAKKIKEFELHKNRLSNQLNELNNQQNQPSGEIMINVLADQQNEGNFTVSYLVGNAGWYPQYDIRAKDVASPIELKYKANVNQITGEDWENIRLSLSNANPRQSGTAPVFSPWYIDFQVIALYESRRSYDKPAAMKMADQETMESESLAEVVTTTVVENQTSINFVVPMPYTVKSNGENLLIDVNSYSVPATYHYYSFPKYDQDAFLMANITDWDQYNLLPGEANLYFENTYVGKSIIDPAIQSDTLKISLGRDKSVILSRVKMDEFTVRKSIAANKIDTRGFNIKIRNNKSKPVSLTVVDQVPLSVRSEIVVTPLEVSGAQYEKTTGQLKWILILEPQEQKELKFQYEVKYPKNQKILLE